MEGLLEEWLEARERGEDRTEELLERAGDQRPRFETMVRTEKKLRALRGELGLGPTAEPALIGRFQLLGVLGRGGSSIVHRAYDPELGRRIALKVLTGAFGPDQRAWILNEARALAKLDHPNVLKVYEVGESDSLPFVAMELLTGPSLREVLGEWTRQRSGVGDPAREPTRQLALRLTSYSERLRCLIQLSDALSYCHDQGVLHRDIKPENVLFDATGAPKLIDFGLAHDASAEKDTKLNLTQSLVGTPAYIAPEQIANSRVGADPHSDQFVFATLVYECFALENPFLRRDHHSTLEAIRAANPPPLASKAPAVLKDLAVVVRHAHDLDPERRYPAMEAMAADLRAVLEHEPISARAPSLLHRTHLWIRRHHRGVRGASMAFLLAFVFWSTLASLQTSGNRKSLLAELLSIRPGGFEQQTDFDEAYRPLKELQDRAASFDASFLRSAFWGAVGPEVERVVVDWSRGLHDLFARETEERGSAGMQPPEGLFPRLFILDSILCPNAPWNEATRKRGTVHVVPDDLAGARLEYYKYRPKDLTPGVTALVFQAFRWNPRPEFGTYHVFAVDPGDDSVLGETVLFVPQGWFQEIVQEIRAPRAEFFPSTLGILGGQVSIGPGSDRCAVLDFLILDHLVLTEEFELFCNATERAPIRGEKGRPAWVSYDEAMAFAAWAGGRLPTRSELLLVRNRGFDVRPPPFDPVIGEFVLDIHPLPSENPGWFEHATGSMFIVERSNLSRGKAGSKVGFRIAFSRAAARAYHELAQEFVIPP